MNHNRNLWICDSKSFPSANRWSHGYDVETGQPIILALTHLTMVSGDPHMRVDEEPALLSGVELWIGNDERGMNR